MRLSSWLLAQSEERDASIGRAKAFKQAHMLLSPVEEASTMPRLPLAVNLWVACNLAVNHIHSRQFPCT